MKRFPLLLAGIAILIGLVSCDNPQRTVDQTRNDIQAFRARPGAETQEKVDKSFVRLNEEIAKLEHKESAASGKTRDDLDTQLAKLHSQHSDLLIDYQAAKVGKVVEDFKNTMKDIGTAAESLQKTFQKNFQPSASTNSGN
ncbi:MAG: hypothetical protein ABI443_11355 [Chthoniobacterales bacterium]